MPFSNSFSHEYTVEFFRGYMACDIATIECRSRYEKLIPSGKPDIREVLQKCKTMSFFSLSLLSLENVFIFRKYFMYYYLNELMNTYFKNFCFRL